MSFWDSSHAWCTQFWVLVSICINIGWQSKQWPVMCALNKKSVAMTALFGLDMQNNLLLGTARPIQGVVNPLQVHHVPGPFGPPRTGPGLVGQTLWARQPAQDACAAYKHTSCASWVSFILSLRVCLRLGLIHIIIIIFYMRCGLVLKWDFNIVYWHIFIINYL